MQARLRAKLTAYVEISDLLLRYPVTFSSLTIVSLLAALASVLQVTLVIPLLQTAQPDAGSLSNLPIIGFFGHLANNMTVVERIRFVAVALIVITLIQGVFTYTSRLLSFLLQVKVDRGLREQVFKQVMNVELSIIHGQRIGNLFTILNSYTADSGWIVQVTAGAVVNIFLVAMYATLTFLVSWQLTLVAVVLLLLVFLLIRRGVSAKISRAGHEVNQATAELNAMGIENLSAIKLIHLFAKEQTIVRRFIRALSAYQNMMYRRSKLFSLTGPLFSTAIAVVLALLLIASTLVLPGQADSWIGLMVLFLIVMYRLMAPASALNDARAQIAGAYPSLRSVLDFLRREGKTYLTSGSIRFQELKTGGALEGVTFYYDPSEPPVLRDVSFEIPKGKVTAVVGPSGAGKTTLVNLIARLYDPQAGQITIDSIDLRELEIASWREKIAVVSQETFIFNDTVKANLRFANEEATEAEVREAALLASAHEFIMALPQGYDTLLGDRGVRLSGGQQQRIAIARAILANPQLLILDEATSSLDSETERAIQEAIEQVSRERTVLAIAHRLSTIRNADKIVVISQGRVVEQGNHEELMQLNGHYCRLVEMQTLDKVGATAD